MLYERSIITSHENVVIFQLSRNDFEMYISRWIKICPVNVYTADAWPSSTNTQQTIVLPDVALVYFVQ